MIWVTQWAKAFLYSNSNQAVIDKKKFFQKLPESSHTHNIRIFWKYNLNFFRPYTISKRWHIRNILFHFRQFQAIKFLAYKCMNQLTCFDVPFYEKKIKLLQLLSYNVYKSQTLSTILFSNFFIKQHIWLCFLLCKF